MPHKQIKSKGGVVQSKFKGWTGFANGPLFQNLIVYNHKYIVYNYNL